FQSKRSKLEASIRNQNRAGWLQTLFVDMQHDDYTVAGQEAVSVLSTLGASLARTKADNPINPNRGWKLYTQIRGASDDVLSDATFMQWYGSAKHVFGFGRSRLLSRLEIGATWIDARDELPASLRYFVGGDQSIRGFDYRELGPVNADDEVVGGKQLIVGSLEYDFLVRVNWRVAVFADTGISFNDRSLGPVNADNEEYGGKQLIVSSLEYDFLVRENWRVAEFADTGNAINDRDDLEWRHSAGLGIRWLSPIGPVRVDIAHPVDGK